MKKKTFCTLLSFVLMIVFVIKAQGQVTIGAGEPPIAGALLDLKEKATTDGSANSSRGLLLPRVVLSSLKPLSGKLSESIGNTGTWDEKGHIGLMVYNAKNTVDICAGGAFEGVYSWTGTEWLALYENKGAPPTDEKNSDEYKGANSYIVKTGTVTTIPLERAYKIWNAYVGSNKSTGHVLSLGDVNSLNGILTAQIVWQDISSISSVSINGTGSTANLIVNTGSSQGNALVRVLIGGKVLWQWHIWVTNDDIHNAARLYRKNGVEEWYMDRFLGANATKGNGLYYQWGRNVPLNSSSTNTIQGTDSENENLTNAIQSEKFISFASTKSHDWYSASKKAWDSRWGVVATNTTKKSPFDPCPRGWRVPSQSDNGNPWECFENLPDTELSFYPKGGYLSNGNGSVGDVGTAGYAWSANPLASMAATLYYDANKIENWTNYNRANAMNVRCVKEK